MSVCTTLSAFYWLLTLESCRYLCFGGGTCEAGRLQPQPMLKRQHPSGYAHVRHSHFLCRKCAPWQR